MGRSSVRLTLAIVALAMTMDAAHHVAHAQTPPRVPPRAILQLADEVPAFAAALRKMVGRTPVSADDILPVLQSQALRDLLRQYGRPWPTVIKQLQATIPQVNSAAVSDARITLTVASLALNDDIVLTAESGWTRLTEEVRRLSPKAQIDRQRRVIRFVSPNDPNDYFDLHAYEVLGGVAGTGTALACIQFGSDCLPRSR
jgi:hypothetical protein